MSHRYHAVQEGYLPYQSNILSNVSSNEIWHVLGISCSTGLLAYSLVFPSNEIWHVLGISCSTGLLAYSLKPLQFLFG